VLADIADYPEKYSNPARLTTLDIEVATVVPNFKH
jgi:hypothetical protein